MSTSISLPSDAKHRLHVDGTTPLSKILTALSGESIQDEDDSVTAVVVNKTEEVGSKPSEREELQGATILPTSPGPGPGLGALAAGSSDLGSPGTLSPSHPSPAHDAAAYRIPTCTPARISIQGGVPLFPQPQRTVFMKELSTALIKQQNRDRHVTASFPRDTDVDDRIKEANSKRNLSVTDFLHKREQARPASREDPAGQLKEAALVSSASAQTPLALQLQLQRANTDSNFQYDRLEPLLAQEVYVASARSSTSSLSLDEEEKEKEEDKCTWL